MAVTDAVLEWDGGRVRFTSTPEPDAWARFVLTDLSGWYGGVGVRDEKWDRLGHGEARGRTWRGSRALTLKGHVEVDTPENRDAVMRDLSGVLWNGLEGTLSATVDGLTLSCPVTLDGEPGVVPSGITAVTVQLPLVSGDPWLFSEWRTSSIRPIGSGVGLEYPLFTGGVLRYGTAVDSGDVIWNDGNADSWPRFTVHADADGGFLVGVGDRVLTFPWPVWEDSPATVDTMTGEVLIGGVDQSHRLASREWTPVLPHSLEAVRFELLQGGTGWCDVSHRDTYI